MINKRKKTIVAKLRGTIEEETAVGNDPPIEPVAAFILAIDTSNSRADYIDICRDSNTSAAGIHPGSQNIDRGIGEGAWIFAYRHLSAI